MLRFRRRPMYMAVKSPVPRKILRFLIIVFVIYLLIQTFSFVEAKLRPTIIAIAGARATILATEAINEAIYENIAKDSRYENLVFAEKDRDGNVTSVEINNMELVRIHSMTTLSVQSALEALQNGEMKIPLGQALGSEIFASWGPKIKVTFTPIGTVKATVRQSFESAGINIVSHQIGLDITATVQIVVPFIKQEIEVITYVPLVTATFFGKVPETVINLPPYDFQFPSRPGDE